MTKPLDFWFDFSCPYAYLASTQVEALAARTGAELCPRPMLLGGVFRALDVPQNLAATLGAAKARHTARDSHRWAELWDVPLIYPKGHPIRTVTALRALLAVGAPFMPLTHAFFRAYWVDGVDLSTDEGVAAVLRGAGHDAEKILRHANTPEIKDELRQRTDEAIAAGVFGAPAMVVDGELIWGQDRLDVVEARLGGSPRGLLDGLPGPETARPTDFWFDYSSPYSALATARVEPLFGDTLRFKPVLLGGIFRDVGMDNIPMQTYSVPKRQWASRDMARQAEACGFPLKWPKKFPMRTILPLRMTLVAGPDTPDGRRLTQAIFRAYWAEGRDISTPEVLAEVAETEGLDGKALLEGTQDPAIKGRLIELGQQAVAAGLFGAPTCVVHMGDGSTELFWGNDRLELAARTARAPR